MSDVRLYYTGASPNNLRKARDHAPSHTHGYGWTPQKMTPHDAPFFLDNGAYTRSFDADAYYETTDRDRERGRLNQHSDVVNRECWLRPTGARRPIAHPAAPRHHNTETPTYH